MRPFSPMDIVYDVSAGDSRWTYRVTMDAETMENLDRPREKPAWTKLDHQKCSHCPLKAKKHPHCPLALQMVELVDRCTEIISYEEVSVEVTTPDRVYSKTTTAQRAISSMMGLVMATSGCPHTRPLRTMARFHLPFATEKETMYRALSAYMLSQYFQNKDGNKPDLDLDGLRTIYENIHTLNVYFTKRLLTAVQLDSSVNALVVLDAFAQTVTFVIDDSLIELEHLFES